MSETKEIKTIVLNNNAELCLYDASRKIAGDRWVVILIAKIEIPVGNAEAYANDISLDDFKAFRESQAGVVFYERKQERNFIDSDHKNDILHSLMDSFLESSLAYLSHPDFPRKYVLRQYKQYQKRKLW